MAAIACGLALALTGCTPPPYRCVADTQCIVMGVAGRCVQAGVGGDGFCAFPDGRCPGSGLRWDNDNASPGEIKNQCVPPGLVNADGGTD